MSKHWTRFLAALSLFVMVAATAALAQSGGVLEINIPFPFAVNQTTLPAGQYTVQILPHINGGLLIRSVDGQSVMTALTISVQSKSSSEEGKLTFHCYGDQYFLSQVWMPGNLIGHELKKSRHELELAKNTEKDQPSSTVLVAHRPPAQNRTKGK